MKYIKISFLMIVSLWLSACGRVEIGVHIPDSVSIIKKIERGSLRGSVICYELCLKNKRAPQELLDQLDFVVQDHAELKFALNEAEGLLGGEGPDKQYNICYKHEGKQQDIWLLFENTNQYALLLVQDG